MDKNKDFIRLDDVFKNLDGGTEPYRSEAWDQMKNLLDKEMPVESEKKRRFGFLLPLLGLLLLAGTGSGIYYWNASKNISETIVVQPTDSKLDVENHSSEIKQSQDLPIEMKEKPFDNSDVNNTYTANTKENQTLNAEKVNQQTANTEHSVATKQGNNLTSNQRTNNQILAKNQLQKDKQHNQNQVSVIHKETENKISEETIALQASLKSIKEESLIEQIKPKNDFNKEQNSKTVEEIATKHQLTKVENPVNEQDIYQHESGGLYKEQKDTFNRVVLAAGNKKVNQKIEIKTQDTVSIAKVARISFVPLNATEVKQFYTGTNIKNIPAIPNYTVAANLTTENNTSTDNIYASNLSANSHKHQKSNKIGFSRLVENVSYNIIELMNGSKNWYLSMIVGGNAGLNQAQAYGGQLGLSFLYSINDKLTFSTGLMYRNSLFPNYSFSDSSIDYSLNIEEKPFGTTFFGTATTHSTLVNINHLSKIDLPVMVSYSLGKFSVFSGLQFSYFLPMNFEYSTHSYSQSVSREVYDNTNPFQSKAYQLNTANDFRSRFGMGYLAGIGYDFTKTFSMDLRLNQTFWDNTGKYELKSLKNIYHQPNLQLNFGFYMGRREKVVYFMDR